jgi:hypothetical protein
VTQAFPPSFSGDISPDGKNKTVPPDFDDLAEDQESLLELQKLRHCDNLPD